MKQITSSRQISSHFGHTHAANLKKSINEVIENGSITRMSKKDIIVRRSRGLNQMENHFGKNSIFNFIKDRLNAQGEARVLEIGFGEGRCLLELGSLFSKYSRGNVKFYGINIRKEGGSIQSE